MITNSELKILLEDLPVQTYDVYGSSTRLPGYEQHLGPFTIYTNIQVITKVTPLPGYEEDGRIRFDPLPEGSVKHILYFDFTEMQFQGEDILREGQQEIIENYLEYNIIKFD